MSSYHDPSNPNHEHLAHALRHHINAQRQRTFGDLAQLCTIPSLALNDEHAKDMDRSAAMIRDLMVERGLETEIIDTSDGSPAIVGKRAAKNNAPTVLLYCHHDVVDISTPEEWESDPFILTERDGRWYARGAADCKGNLLMHLAAIRAVDAVGGCDAGIILVCEGSEERGGQGLQDLVDERPELFDADLICIADTASGQAGLPTLTTSLRGGGQLTVTVDTLEAPVHSGQFGGAAPDAVAALVRVLATLHDDDGQVAVDGLGQHRNWDGSPYPAEEDEARDAAGLLDGVDLLGASEDEMADLVWARPAVTITGFSSTPVEEAINAVPATASAQLNLRVPPGVDTQQAAERVATHLRENISWGAHIDVEITSANPSFSADTSGKIFGLLSECIAEAYGQETEMIGTGGSIPLTVKLAEKFPDAEFGLYGVAESASAIHSSNESVDPEEIERLALAEALLLTRLHIR